MINQIVDSNLSTHFLELMYETNEAMIENMKVHDVEPKELIGWRNKIGTAISIRKAIYAS